MSCRNIGKMTLALLVVSGSCESKPVCSIDPDRPACFLDVSVTSQASSLVAQEQDSRVLLQIAKRREDQAMGTYPVWLVDPGGGGQAVRVGEAMYLKEVNGGGGLFQVLVGKNNPRLKLRQHYAIRVGIPGSETVPDAVGESDPMVTTVKRTIRHQTPTVLAQKMQAQTDYPQLRLLGMVGNALVGAGSGASGTGTLGQKLKTWMGASLSTGTVGSFWSAPVEASVQIGTTGNRVLLGNPTNSV